MDGSLPDTRGKPSIIATQGGLHKELAGGLKKPRTRSPFSYEYTLLHKVSLPISFEFINVRSIHKYRQSLQVHIEEKHLWPGHLFKSLMIGLAWLRADSAS